jgi:flagellar hook assembly protein FlgD
VSSVAFADDFAPTLLKLSAAPEISYAFDESELAISYDVTGYDATVVLVVMTKDKGEEIGFVRNGNLGWHMVNNIDTTIYFSTPEPVGTGTNTITWNGTDLDGNLVDSDTYQYYLWAYAHTTPMQPAAPHIDFGWLEKGKVWTINEDGTPRSKPLICTVPNGVYSTEEVV